MKAESLLLFIILFPVILFISLPIDAQPLEDEIKIGLIPEINIFEQSRRYENIGSYLTARTGTKVSFIQLKHYGNVLGKYKELGLDGAFMGSFTAALANQKLDLSPVVRPVNVNGSSSYKGYIFTRKDSGIKDFKDLKGKVMAYVDKATTAGYIFPVAYLRLNGVTDIEGFFSDYFFAGSHDAAIAAVLGSKADVGAAKNTVYDALSEKNPRINEELLIIAVSTKVPSNGLLLSNSLDENIRNSIKETLLGMDSDPEGKQVLIKFGAQKFLKTTEYDYSRVFSIIDSAGIDLKTYDFTSY